MNLQFSDDVLKLNPDLKPATTYRTKAERTLKATDLDGYDSLLERAFDRELTARAVPHVLHPFTFHLPGGVDYTPDFIGFVADDLPAVYELKGHSKMKNARDSRTRFRIAAGLHPWARFVWVTRSDTGQWIEKPYTGA